MKSVNQTIQKTPRPVKILQYGEGNFLRGFVEYIVDTANEKGVFNSDVQIVKSIPVGSLATLIQQDYIYTVLLRGKKDGEAYTEKRIVTCVAGAVDSYDEYEAYAAFAKNHELRFIISNTTEAGIIYDEHDDIALCPPKSYPGKLTKFLYERYIFFNGAKDKGLIVLPVELIEKNGETLKECCLKLSERWELPEEFKSWLTAANTFCNTLVDRIITGYPKDEIDALEQELGYSDRLLVTGEPYALWVIESDNTETIAKEFPLNRAGLPVIFTNNLQPYRERKVRILNGAHTASVLAAYLSGLHTVGDIMKDKTTRGFLERAVYEELAPMVPLPYDEVKSFADTVMKRFENPFIRHNLFSIALNSVSKFKARVLPTIVETQANTCSLPPLLCFSLAALIAFYCEEPNTMDDASVLRFFSENCALPTGELVQSFLNRSDFWDKDLTQIPGLVDAVSDSLQIIRGNGMTEAVQSLIK